MCCDSNLHLLSDLPRLDPCYCVKSVRICSYSGTYFPVSGLNTERYGVCFCIHSECGKIRTRITPNTDTFLRNVAHRFKKFVLLKNSSLLLKHCFRILEIIKALLYYRKNISIIGIVCSSKRGISLAFNMITSINDFEDFCSSNFFFQFLIFILSNGT